MTAFEIATIVANAVMIVKTIWSPGPMSLSRRPAAERGTSASVDPLPRGPTGSVPEHLTP
jgi:hypothetical protein